MLYYQFSVSPSPNHADFKQLGPGVASIMIRCDDIAEGTANALNHLASERWEVIEVRNARVAESAEEFSYDPRLYRLYDEAEKNAIACLLIAPRLGKQLPKEEVPTM